VDIKALREFINEHPDGVVIRMVDGTEYRLPHRDYAWFTPASPPAGRATRPNVSAFWLHDPEKDVTRLVNAMLVRDVSPLGGNGDQSGGPRNTRSTER